MKPSLTQLIAPYKSISIIGMCKNAGKTTVLNRILREARGRTLALTSIGRDGEDKDLVTGTKKPGIYVSQGTLLATASDLLLHRCDVTREILETTGISTPMGEVVLLRALSDGSIQLAGPSITDQLSGLREMFFRFGADQVIIDGALSRKTLCSRKVTEATILCTGASYSKSLDTVVEDTTFQCRLLTLPETKEPQVLTMSGTDTRDTFLFDETGTRMVTNLENALRSSKSPRSVFFGGALSDFTLKPLLMSNAALDGLTFVVRDASKLLLKQDTFRKLQHRGACLKVLDSVNLVALTVNPFSAYGSHFSKEELMSRMEACVDLPVIDVMEDAV